MSRDPNLSKQGSVFDVAHDPDGWAITCEFYACVSVIGLALAALWSVWP